MDICCGALTIKCEPFLEVMFFSEKRGNGSENSTPCCRFYWVSARLGRHSWQSDWVELFTGYLFIIMQASSDRQMTDRPDWD